MSLTVEMFHREGQFVVFSDGASAPITNWIDSDGNNCGPFDYPVTAVAGPDANEKWHSIDLSEFDPVTLQ